MLTLFYKKVFQINMKSDSTKIFDESFISFILCLIAVSPMILLFSYLIWWWFEPEDEEEEINKVLN